MLAINLSAFCPKSKQNFLDTRHHNLRLPRPIIGLRLSHRQIFLLSQTILNSFLFQNMVNLFSTSLDLALTPSIDESNNTTPPPPPRKINLQGRVATLRTHPIILGLPHLDSKDLSRDYDLPSCRLQPKRSSIAFDALFLH